MTKVAHLYKITNTVTGEYYIGKHNGWTQNGYWGSGNRIRRLLDEKCLNLTIGGQGVGYMSEDIKQKLREARAKQIMPADMYEKTSKIMSSLIWMNDGIRSYRIRPDNVQISKEKGMVEGRLMDYINNEYRNKFKNYANKQWQKVKETGHTGHLIKVN